jgi:hypothetical protein
LSSWLTCKCLHSEEQWFERISNLTKSRLRYVKGAANSYPLWMLFFGAFGFGTGQLSDRDEKLNVFSKCE